MPPRPTRTIQNPLSRASSVNSNSPSKLMLFGLVIFSFVLSISVFLLHATVHAATGGEAAKQLRSGAAGAAAAKEAVGKEAAVPAAAAEKDEKESVLIVTMSVGVLRIVLRPDWSAESSAYFQALVASGGCDRCTFYRAEAPGILQGIAKHSSVPIVETKGSCPEGYESVPNDCPAWDKGCGCHGPVMKRGYVGWAAGKTGPDFFIDAYQKDAKFWGTQHTVWGEIKDSESFAVIDQIWTLGKHNQGGLTMLDEPLHFTLSLE